jgi:type II secretory pathway pseudopilin PulG
MMNSRTNQGFTLVEIMLSIALLMVTVVAVMGVITSNSASNRLAHERETALNVAAGQMERIFRDLPANVDTYNEEEADFTTNELTFPDGQPAQVLTDVFPVEGNPQLRDVVVQVIWSDDMSPVELRALRRTI